MIVSFTVAILWLFHLNSQILVSHSFRVTRLRLFYQNIVIRDHSSTSIYLSQYCASKKTLSTQLNCINNKKDSDSDSDGDSQDFDSHKSNDQIIPTSSRSRAVNNNLQAASWLSKSLLSFATYVSYKDVIHPLSVQALVTQQQQQQQKGVKGYEAAESAFSPGKILPSYIIPILPQSALLNSLNIIDNKLVSEMQNYLESFVQLINPTLRQIKQIENKDSSLWKNLRLNAQRAAGMFIYNRNEFIPSNNTLVDNLRQQQQRDFFNQQQSNTTTTSSTNSNSNKENNYFFATNKIDQEVFEELQKTQFRQRYLNNLKYDVLNLVRASEQADTIECLRFMRNSLNSLLEVAYLLTPFSSSSSGITVERDPPITLTSGSGGSGSKSNSDRGGDSSNNSGTLLYEVQTGTRRRTEVTLEQMQLEQQQSQQSQQLEITSINSGVSSNINNKKIINSNSGSKNSAVVVTSPDAAAVDDSDSNNNTDEFLPINNIDDKTTQYEESLLLKNQLLHLPQLIGRARVTLYFQRPGPESIMPAVNNRNSKNKNNNSINYFSNDNNSGVNNSGRNRSNKDKNNSNKNNNNNNSNDISTVKLVVDGINHPYTAGNFIDLCQKGYYDATVIKSHLFTYKDQNSNYLPTTTKKFYKNVSNSTKVTSSLFPSPTDNNSTAYDQPQSQAPSKQQEQLELLEQQRIELYDHNVNMTLFGATSLTSGSGGSGTTAAMYTDPTTGRVRRIPLEILRQRTGTSSATTTAGASNSNSNDNNSKKENSSSKNKNNSNNSKDKSSSSPTSSSSKYIPNDRYIATGMARNTALYTKYKPVLSFATYGAMGMYHDPYDGNGASASFFYLPSQSQRRDASTYDRHASSVIHRLNDRYSLFAYVIEGLDILERLREGDVLLSVTIEDGAWELEQLSE